MDEIKLFVGCAPNGEDAESQMVLEYTARKHSSLYVDITWMKINKKDPNSPWYGWNTSLWSTPFSGFRWGIPAVCNFQGQAIYMDSDMIILSDLKKLWEQPFEPGKIVMAKGGEQSWRFCVCKWDCYSTKDQIIDLDNLKKDSSSHRKMMNYYSNHKELVQAFDGDWNNLDGENKPIDQIDILHYTDMSTQFHGKYVKQRGIKHWYDGDVFDHKRKDLQALFDQYYQEALNDGYTVDQYIPNEEDFIEYTKESQKGYVSSSRFARE